MTIERKLVANLLDIRALVLECKTCHARVSVDPDKANELTPYQCPVCSAPWATGRTPNARAFASATATFVALLPDVRKAVRGEGDTNVGFVIHFEFDEPK